MIKKVIKILSVISLILILLIFYLSIFGLETTRFNKKIKNKILESNKRINLDLNTVKIRLSPLDLKVNIITLESKILFDNKKIKLESLKIKVPLLQLFKSQFPIENLQISSKFIKTKTLVSFIRILKNEPKLFLLEMMIKDGHIEGNIDLNFDRKGKIKDDYKLIGSVKNFEIQILKDYHLDNLNYSFDIKEKKYKFLEIDAKFNKIKLNSPLITVEEKNNLFLINGKILTKEKDISFDLIQGLLRDYFVDLDLKDLNFSSENNFSFDLDKKFKLSSLNINSEISLSKLTYKNNFQSIKKYFPKIKKFINLKDHKIKFNYNKDRTKIAGMGKILIQDNEDKINYEIIKKDQKYFFKKTLETKQDISINELQYKKEKKKKASIKIEGLLSKNNNIFFNEISLIENDNSILLKNLNLNNKLKVSDISSLIIFDASKPSPVKV